jgi:hypothetical protein
MLRKKLRMSRVILTYIESMLIKEDTWKIMLTISDRCYRKIKKYIKMKILEL